jgi:outer membrane protein TolC
MARHSWFAAPLAACLVFATAGPAGSQAIVSLDEALASARDRNASVRAARLGTDAAAAGIAEARAGFFPRVTVAERWQRGNEPVFVFGSRLAARQFTADALALDSLNHPDATGAFHTLVGVDQVVFDGGRTAASLEAASLQRDMAHHEADAVAGDVAVRVTLTYGRALVARAARAAAARAVESAGEDVATAERRRDAGLATDADVLSLQVHAADFEQRRIEAEGDYASALGELRYLTGLPATLAFDVIEPAPAPQPRDGPNVDRLAADGAAARPEVLRAEAAVQLEDAVRRQARSALVPQVAVQSLVDFAGTRFADRASSWIVGGEVRWTFSTGGAELARRTAATAAAARAAAQRDEARARAIADVTSAVHRLEAARARQRVGEAAVAQARESERIVRDRFDAGLATPADILRVSAASFDAEQRRVAALADVLARHAELDRVAGRSVEGAQP